MQKKYKKWAQKKLSDLNVKRVAILVGMVLCIILFILFLRGCSRTPDRPKLIPVKEIIKKVEKSEKQVNTKIDSIEQQNSRLQLQFSDMQKKLFAAQKINRYLANRKKDTTIIERNEYENGSAYVEDLINAAAQSDSLCNLSITNLESQITAKDSIVNWQNIKYQAIKSQFDVVANQHLTLEQSNKDYRRALRKKKFSNIVWKAAIVAAGAFIILKK